MKKVLAICLTMAMVLCMSATVCAAPDGFVSSPSGNAAPGVISCVPGNTDCTIEVIVTPYGEKDELPADQREQLEKAYDDITGADDLTELSDELEKAAKDKGISADDLAVSDLFNVRGIGCDDHDDHKNFKIVLSANTLKNFVGLLQMDEDGNWSMVQGVRITADGNLEFSLENLGTQLAIVVDAAGNESPQTGDNNAIYIYGALMAVSALALIVLVIKSKKKA